MGPWSRPTFYLRLQTGGDRIRCPIGVLGLPIFIINLHESNFGELFEIRHEQICDGEVSAFGRAATLEEDMGDAIPNLQPAVTGESVIERDPAEGESFC